MEQLRSEDAESSWTACSEGTVVSPYKANDTDLIELNWPLQSEHGLPRPGEADPATAEQQELAQEDDAGRPPQVVVTDAESKQNLIQNGSRTSNLDSVDSQGATSKSNSEAESETGLFGSWKRSLQKAFFGTPSPSSKTGQEMECPPEEDFALLLLELSLAVCDAGTEVLQEFARRAQQDSKLNYKILKRLMALARTIGLISHAGAGDVTGKISCQLPVPVRDLAKAFMQDDLSSVEWVAGAGQGTLMGMSSRCTTAELGETGNLASSPTQASGSFEASQPQRLQSIQHSSSVSSQDGTLGLPPRPAGLNHSSSVSSSDGTLGLPRPVHIQHSSSLSSTDGTLRLPRLLGLNHSTSNLSSISCRQGVDRSGTAGLDPGSEKTEASASARRQFGQRRGSSGSTSSLGGFSGIQRRIGLMRGSSNSSHLANEDGLRRMQLNRSCSNFSAFSCTSFNDFNRKHGLTCVEAPSFLQFLATVNDAGVKARSSRTRRLHSIQEKELDPFSNMHEVDDMDGFDRMSYHSSQEMGKASVFEMITGSGSVMVSTRCLKTQAAWQRSLIEQQRCLLGLVSRKLHQAEEKTRVDIAVSEDQREMLRSFRKIVTRNVEGEDADLQGKQISVIIVETCPTLRAELTQLCQLLEYRCMTFGSLKAAAAEISNLMESAGAKATESPTFLVLLGTAWLNRELPVQFKQDPLYLTLTSKPEELEMVGSELCASSEDQIRLLLKERGIREYLLHPLSLEDLRRTAEAALQRRWAEEYLVCETLGRGSSGVVHRVKRLRDGHIFAMKEVPTRLLREKDRESLLQEVSLLQKMSWPTIVSLTSAWENRQQRLHYIVMPFMEGGSLKSRISLALLPDAAGDCVSVSRSCSGFSIREKHMGAWYLQCLHGLGYLHSQGILHRDIKPDNLLLGQGGVSLQICDFGSAMRLPGKGPHPRKDASVEATVTTPLYSAPEVAKWQHASAASDMWSVGATFYEVITLQTLAPPHFQGPQELGSWLVALADSASAESSSTATGSPASASGVPLSDFRKALEALELTAGIATDYDFREEGKLEELLRLSSDLRPCAAEILAERNNIKGLRQSLTLSKSTSNDVQAIMKDTCKMMKKCLTARGDDGCFVQKL